MNAFCAGHSPLILTERTQHLEILRDLLEPEIERLVVLKGGLGKKKLAAINESLDEWKDLPHVVLARIFHQQQIFPRRGDEFAKSAKSS